MAPTAEARAAATRMTSTAAPCGTQATWLQARSPRRSARRLSKPHAALRTPAAAVAPEVVTTPDARATPPSPLAPYGSAHDRSHARNRQHAGGKPEGKYDPGDAIRSLSDRGQQEGSPIRRRVVFERRAEVAPGGPRVRQAEEAQAAHTVSEVYPQRRSPRDFPTVLFRTAMALVPQRNAEWKDGKCSNGQHFRYHRPLSYTVRRLT
jgi:hypothetical protein